jgi:primosomal protein N'
MIAEEATFLTLCKSCGFEYRAPGNCTECGAAFHY